MVFTSHIASIFSGHKKTRCSYLLSPIKAFKAILIKKFSIRAPIWVEQPALINQIPVIQIKCGMPTITSIDIILCYILPIKPLARPKLWLHIKGKAK